MIVKFPILSCEAYKTLVQDNNCTILVLSMSSTDFNHRRSDQYSKNVVQLQIVDPRLNRSLVGVVSDADCCSRVNSLMFIIHNKCDLSKCGQQSPESFSIIRMCVGDLI